MSLIQEALEKAGRMPAAGKAVTASQTPSPAHEKAVPVSGSQPQASKNAKVILGIFIFLSGFILLHLLGTRVQYSSPKKDGGQALLPLVEARVPSIMPDLTLHPRFSLTGITTSGTERLALINNQVVGVGDRIGEKAIVKEIQERRVILEFQGREVQLKL